MSLPQDITATLRGSLDQTSTSLRRLVASVAPLRAASAAGRPFLFCVDMSGVSWVSPVAIAIIAATIRNATSSRGEGHIIRPTSADVHDYLKRLEFYGAAGAEGVEPYAFRRLDSAGRFCELVEVTSEQRGFDTASAVTDIIATQLSLDKEATSAVFVSLSEVTDNVFHHGKARAFVCAQTYPKKKTVELAIVDCGAGFAASLARNPRLRDEYSNDESAITLALKARVTCNPGGNAGLGLYLTSEFVRRNEGTMLVGSGNGLVAVLGTQFATVPMSTWPGAIVAVRFRVDRPLDADAVYSDLGDPEDDNLDDWLAGS